VYYCWKNQNRVLFVTLTRKKYYLKINRTILASSGKKCPNEIGPREYTSISYECFAIIFDWFGCQIWENNYEQNFHEGIISFWINVANESIGRQIFHVDRIPCPSQMGGSLFLRQVWNSALGIICFRFIEKFKKMSGKVSSNQHIWYVDIRVSYASKFLEKKSIHLRCREKYIMELEYHF
jgi:hypothetical protein